MSNSQRHPLALLALVLWLVMPGSDASAQTNPVAESELEAGAPSEEAGDPLIEPNPPEDTPPEIVRMHALASRIRDQVAFIEALQQDETAASGDDAKALHDIATKIKLDLLGSIRKMAGIIVALEEQGADTTDYRERLHGLMPTVRSNLRELFHSEQKYARDLAEEAAASTGDAREAIDLRVARQDAMIGGILAASLAQIETLETLGRPSDEERIWLGERLEQQARLMSARIRTSSIQLEDATARSSEAPEDTARKIDVAAARARHKVAIDALGSTVSQMQKLDLDTAVFQHVLISATGEITTDVFERGVARHLLASWFHSLTDSVVENGPNFIFKSILFVLVVLFFWTLARFVRRVTQRALNMRQFGFSELLKRMIVSTASFTVLVMGLLIALSQLGIEVGPMLAGLGIAGFVLGFALQDTLANFAAGIMILAYRPYDVRDLIDCAGGVFGRVSQMNLVSTTILTVDNQTRVVPNGKIWGDVITNVTAQKNRRVDLMVGISYDDDIPQAEEIIRGILDEHPLILKEPEAVVKVHELGDSSVNLVVRPWVARDDYWDVHWDVTREVKLRFDREGISIPYPQQDLHLKLDTPPKTTDAPMEVGRSSATSHDAPETDD